MMTGFFLGFLSFISWYSVYHKMPESVRKFCAKHSLFTDLVTTLATYITLGSISGSLASAFAAAWVGIFMELAMYVERNPEDFSWFTDLKTSMSLHLKQFQNKLKEWNAAYKASKLESYEQEQASVSIQAT